MSVNNNGQSDLIEDTVICTNDADRMPCINYVEKYQTGPKETTVSVTALSPAELEQLFGIRMIRFEFSSPIENTFEPRIE